jgi:hypothetical protein
MMVISGFEVEEIVVDPAGPPPVLVTTFRASLPTLIDVLATTASGFTVGQAIINDEDPSNNYLVVNQFPDLYNQVIWLRISVVHPALNKYDFNIDVQQNGVSLTSFALAGSLDSYQLIYRGFIMRHLGGAA